MPFADIDGGRIHYRIDGDAGAPVLMLSNSLGTDLSMWQRQAAQLSSSFRVLRYDSRGHGRSLVTVGPYNIERLARDVLELLDQLAISRVHFCGLSLGGMVGMWLAANAPGRVDRLVLANTAAHLPPGRGLGRARIRAVEQGGMAGVAGIVIERWFTPSFLGRTSDDVEGARQTLLATSPDGYTACCAAIRDMDRTELKSIRSPTLVIAGSDDPATPPALGRAIADAICGARLIELSAAHLSNIEASEAFNAAVLDILLS